MNVLPTMNVLFIFRDPEFSPNMADKDAAILEAVADCVKDKGHAIRFMKESELTETEQTHTGVRTDELIDVQTDVQVVFSMGRYESTVRILKGMEHRGVRVFNSPASVGLSADRAELTKRLMEGNIPVPPTTIAGLDGEVQCPGFPCWMKRGDGFSQNPEDVAFVDSEDKAKEHCEWMRRQGYKSAVCSAHLDGDLVKFYGVTSGTQPLFYWYYAADGHSKFGLERQNGSAQGYDFNRDSLRSVCESAAKTVGLSVYGGDCIVDKDGGIFLIDLNDWPSFSKCRLDAAVAISSLVDEAR